MNISHVKHKRPSGLELISILFAITGTSLIVTKGDFSSIILSPIALMAGITSALCCVFYTLQPIPGEINLYTLSAILSMILFGTVLAFCFYLKSLDYLSPTEASILTVGEPLCSIILSLIFLNVTFSSIELIGAVLILSTVLS